jgi:hypothetical protein
MIPMSTNPIRQARIDAKRSLAEFAKECGVSRVAVQRTESGCYIEVPPAIVTGLLNHLTVLSDGTPLTTENEIQAAYSEYQKQTRRDTYLQQKLLPDATPPVGVSPVVYWRLMSGVPSQLEFCKLLCLHPYVIDKTESGAQKSLPKQLVVVMQQAGYDDSLIELLDRKQQEYAKGRV